MMMTAPSTEVQELILREALLIDTGQFTEWIELFTVDVVFWMPTWKDETTLTDDPDRELSLIYYKGRRNLEDRVMRMTSGLSTASSPLPRVVHQVTNILQRENAVGGYEVSAAFVCYRFDVRMGRTDYFFGRYEYDLTREGGILKISRKKIILLNDVIPTVVDVNSI